MEPLSSAKEPRKVSVRCTHCGDWDTINDRSRRRKVAEGKPHLCSICRHVQSIKIEEDDFKYWRSRFSQEEIDALVNAIV